MHLNSLYKRSWYFLIYRSSNLIIEIILKIHKIKEPEFLYKLLSIKKMQMPKGKRLAFIELIRNNFSKPITALEIGTWFGEGSTKVLINELPNSSSLVLIDSWKPFVQKLDSSINKNY